MKSILIKFSIIIIFFSFGENTCVSAMISEFEAGSEKVGMKHSREEDTVQHRIANTRNVDDVLGSEVYDVLRELENEFPFNPDIDLGSALEDHLKGTKSWDDYLTANTIQKIKDAKNLNREALSFLAGSFLSKTFPYYNKNDFIIKVLVQAAKSRYAPALLSLSQMYKNGFDKKISKNATIATLLYNKAITMDPTLEPSVEAARAGMAMYSEEKTD